MDIFNKVIGVAYGPEISIGMSIAAVVLIIFLLISIITFATGNWIPGLIFLSLTIITGIGIAYVQNRFM